MTGTVIMNLTDSYGFFIENVGRTLGDLKLEYQTRFPEFTAEMKINKGGVGQFIEKLIGLENTNALTDFSDGELKTNKADADGAPLETMFISQISSNFDQLISDQISFEDSWIYQKIKNLLYVPICKVDNNPDQWYNRFQNGRRIDIPCEFSIMILNQNALGVGRNLLIFCKVRDQ